TNVTSHDNKIRNIKPRKRLSKCEIHKLSLPAKLADNLQFTYDLISAYDIYIQKRATLIYRRVEFYKQICYTLLDSNSTLNMDMNLHSGDIVQIQEENEQYIRHDTASSSNGYKRKTATVLCHMPNFAAKYIFNLNKDDARIKDGFEQLRRQLPFNTVRMNAKCAKLRCFNVFTQAFTKCVRANKSRNDSLKITGLKILDFCAIRYSSCNLLLWVLMNIPIGIFDGVFNGAFNGVFDGVFN
ncbi:5360_t:CDS:2, partial [Gigaspora rosea]